MSTMLKHKPRVLLLNIGVDREYRERRHKVLSAAGFSVIDASTVDRALQLAERQDLAVAIFGHLVRAEDRLRISSTLRAKNPAVRLVVMYEGSVKRTEHADAVLQIDGPPADLIHSIQYLLS